LLTLPLPVTASMVWPLRSRATRMHTCSFEIPRLVALPPRFRGGRSRLLEPLHAAEVVEPVRLVAQSGQRRAAEQIEGAAADAAAVALQAVRMAVTIGFVGLAVRTAERCAGLLDNLEYTVEAGCRLQQCEQAVALAPR